MKVSRLTGVGRDGVADGGVPTVGILAVCALILAYASLGCVVAVIAETGDPAPPDLTPEQQTLALSLEQKLVAVCCFRQAIAEHNSELAENMRKKLRSMVADGKTEEEVTTYFVSKYGERVLLAPQTSGFSLLAYVMPALAVAGGLAFLLLFFRRSRKPVEAAAVATEAENPAGTDSDADLRTRMREELARFDE